MYNSNPYDEYMRNSLGYNMNPTMMNMYNDNNVYESENNFMYNQANVDNLYPEVYRIVYPMVCRACMNVNENITEDLVSRITNEIYMNIEKTENAKETRDNIQANNKGNATETNLKRQETRYPNPLFRDLIRILVLRELLGRPNRPPFRPGFGYGPIPRNPYMF